jgi:hypothetical protein
VKNCTFNPTGDKFATGDEGGNVYILKLFGVEQGPIIVTPSRKINELYFRCPACQQEQAIVEEQPGHEMTCPTPGCGLRLKLNPFVIEMNR